MNAHRFWTLASASAFLALWALRLHTLSPAFHPDDSPETALAGHVLGVQHPPGYPLPSLAARLASLLLPGHPAFRVSLLAAFFSAMAPLLLAALAWQSGFLSAHGPAGQGLLLACLTLFSGFMPQLWFQGLSAKGGHYTLNLCLTLAASLCFLRAADGKSRRCFEFGSLAFGLGLAGHYMSFLLMAPAMLWWAWRSGQVRWRSAAWALPGLSLYVYLPLRARLDPILNWGDPDSLDRFWQVLTRAQYSSSQIAHGLENSLRLARHFADLLPFELSLPGLGLACLGLWSLWQTRTLRPLLLTLALHLALVLLYNKPPADAPWVINAFFLPEFALLCLAALAGAAWLCRRFGRHAASAAAALLAAVLLWSPARYRASDLSGDYLAFDYAHDLLQALPRHSLLLASGGNDAFAIWYFQGALGKRQDVVVYDVPLTAAWYLDQLRREAPGLAFAGPSKEAIVAQLLADPPAGRPLFYSTHNPGDRGIPYALASLVPAAGQPLQLSVAALTLPWQALRRRWRQDRSTPDDGNRLELKAYYPASARALADFARRNGVAPLAESAAELEAAWKP